MYHHARLRFCTIRNGKIGRVRAFLPRNPNEKGGAASFIGSSDRSPHRRPTSRGTLPRSPHGRKEPTGTVERVGSDGCSDGEGKSGRGTWLTAVGVAFGLTLELVAFDFASDGDTYTSVREVSDGPAQHLQPLCPFVRVAADGRPPPPKQQPPVSRACVHGRPSSHQSRTYRSQGVFSTMSMNDSTYVSTVT